MSSVTSSRPRSLMSASLRNHSARWVLELAAVAAGALLVAVLARVSFSVGPVPISGQTLGVLLIGCAYGSKRGAATMASYMAVGLLGVPVFAGGVGGPLYVLAPSFGFVLGFIPCAWVAGYFADRGWDRHVGRGLLSNGLASIVPFVIGVPYMVLVLSLSGTVPSFAQAMEWGLLPFIPGGIVKAAIAALALPAAWRIRDALVRRTNREGQH
jgi:biotin transport system substrate-specific component